MEFVNFACIGPTGIRGVAPFTRVSCFKLPNRRMCDLQTAISLVPWMSAWNSPGISGALDASLTTYIL